ncbi:divalent-cation tolerance protein CutA [Calothrix sp. UHCC 0171]|uniref:divalent-cation tolerance protein CutA n=1 Tax=Calothrix sp. UHCC 0171 TaxID=3110245 RepID=UPI002B21F7B8|nr:divalent-cation tolerance protein CutA [Calothrix sp. UHCC 0171]MEA5572560.1 divalent-cation tolerance protein CutA [Calothrix sp. UHCC 0171]
MEPVFVYVTCKDRAEAIQVGKSLVETRLAACANVIDGMDSIYWWKDQLEVAKEAILILKSRRDLLEELTKKVKLEHSYEVPCVVALPITGGNQDYLDWLLAETS